MIKWTFYFGDRSAESIVTTLVQDHEITQLVKNKSKTILHISGHPRDLYINMEFIACATREVTCKEESKKKEAEAA